ncbi:hypothetical protein Tco_0703574 [Tanacetum coccineum]|uniref:Uncharacterized protein n=1 Tax=Tanacetum coccineum TaxID=301880 RepID=A0ABQ4Y0S6_9ASTR
MDANKKIDLKHPLCPNERKLLANILQNHPLRFSIAVSSSVPWIYLGQFWHTLKEDGSKYRLKFVLDRKELTLTLDDFRTIFHLPQATDNNHDHFVPTPKFSKMVPFYINNLGFTLEFTKLIVSHYMTAFPEILRRARDKYHNLEDDEVVKSIFNSGKHKDEVRMKIPNWMITDEMKLTKNYRMYVMVFRVDVPMTQSQTIESTQGMYRLTSAPRTPNPDVAEGELEPESNKESLEVEITDAEEPVNVIEEEEESELTVNDPPPSSSTPSSSSPKPKLFASQHILSLFKPKTGRFKRYKSFFDELQGRYGYFFEHLKTRCMPRKKFHELAQHLQEVMKESLPKMVDTRVKELTKTQVPIYVAQGLIMERQQSQADVAKMIAYVDSSVRSYMSGHILHLTLKYKFERLHVSDTPCKPFAVRPRDQDDPHDDAHPDWENSAKRQKMSEHRNYVFGESSSGQVNESELGPSTSVIFFDDDIEERTSRWVDKCVKKFNPYARYNVEHWKNPHAKIFYIKKQKEPRKSKEVVDDYAETGLLWSLSIFIRSIVI